MADAASADGSSKAAADYAIPGEPSCSLIESWLIHMAERSLRSQHVVSDVGNEPTDLDEMMQEVSYPSGC
jgi:hypothetical protein